MTYRALALFSALSIVVAQQAMAFDHKRTEFSLGYQNYSSDFDDVDGPYARIKTDFGFSPNVGTQLNLSYGQLSDGTNDLDATTIGLHPYYEFGNGNRAGVFLQQTTASFDLAPNDIDVTYYGVEGIVNPLPNLALEGYVGFGEWNSGGSDLDIRTIGMQVNYGITSQIAARFAADFDTIDTGFGDVQFDSYTLGIDYYAGSVGSPVPMILSAEYGQLSFSGQSADRLAINVTIPLGGGVDTSARKLYRDRGVQSQFPLLFGP